MNLHNKLYSVKLSIKNKIASTLQYRSQDERTIPPFFYVGFHGDEYLLHVVDTIIPKVRAFVETGTNIGSTLTYLAGKYPNTPCFSCEPDSFIFQHALRKLEGLPNVLIYNETSQKFIKRLQQEKAYLFDLNALFWLDAHDNGFDWPLKEEISFITSNFKNAYILIDDFKVPDLDCFGYDAYQDQECSLEYIKDALNRRNEYRVYYPNYTDRTSQYHPLRGWGLLEFGSDNLLKLPEHLQCKVKIVDRLNF